MSAVSFDTAMYQFVHGRAPRGVGSWAFSFDRSEAWFAPASLSFGDAKQAAKAEAKQRGAARVTVLS